MDPTSQLLARDQHGMKFGLDNIRALCEILDHPEVSTKTLIVGGTNGKGSVTAMTATALSAAGHRTARYTSPHLIRLEERFVIDGTPVETDLLAVSVEDVLAAESVALTRGMLSAPATFFELTTATAFDVFRRAKVDVTVLEVGMGGRFDATNAADPLVAAITSIAFDHMSFLGWTHAAIAFEKAGILRAGRGVVVGPMTDEASAVIRAVAKERGAWVVDALRDVEVDAVLGSDGRSLVTIRTPRHNYGPLPLALRGRHQIANAVVATRLLELADDVGIRVLPDAVATGLSDAQWPARLEEVTTTGGVRVLLDAAHNPAGAAALAEYLRDTHAPPAALVFGVMRDKDAVGMLRALAPHAQHIVFTSARSTRALPADELRAAWTQIDGSPVASVAESPREAFDLASRLSAFVVVAGSMLVIGELLPHLATLCEGQTRPDPSEGCGILRTSRG